MKDSRKRVEPLGHVHELSKFERIWDQSPPGHAIARHRVERFDPQNMVAFSPVEYEFVEISPLNASDGVSLSDERLLQEFKAFVRDEFTTDRDVVAAATVGPPAIVGREGASLADVAAYLAAAEEFLIYGPYMRELKRRPGSVGEFVHAVLCDDLLGNPANRKHIFTDELINAVNVGVDAQDRLAFGFLGFPFKDQNSLRTDASAAHVDYAEIGMLMHLHLQALALYQRHSFGADYVVLSDGGVYADIFGVERSAAEQYVARLRAVRNALNLQGSIHIIDLEACILHLPREDQEEFDLLRKRVRKFLDSPAMAAEPSLAASFRSLCVGMRRNLNSRKLLSAFEWSDRAKIIQGDESAGGVPGGGSAMRELNDRARTAALEYASLNVALRVFRVVHRVLNGLLRATIHPKSGQIAVPRSGPAYPWNGVGVRRRGRDFPGGIESHILSSLAGKHAEWIAGYLPGEAYPAYYREA